MSKFEGPEKKLEIILYSHQKKLGSNSNGRWHRVVKASKARIISNASTEYLDAYLLSESSLFIWPDRIVMITCGNTTLTNALPDIISIVGKSNVAHVFYQRQKCINPKKQSTNFREDVTCLEEYFPGKSCRVGHDTQHPIDVFYSTHSRVPAHRNTTLQIAMRDLDADAMNKICSTRHGSIVQSKIFSELDSIYPGTITDSHQFSPSGYSMNGISGTNYFTVHVTPHPDASYASFETNFTEKDYCTVIEKLISIFKPEDFSLALMTSMNEQCVSLHSSIGTVPGYIPAPKIFNVFDCGYSLTFLSYALKR